MTSGPERPAVPEQDTKGAQGPDRHHMSSGGAVFDDKQRAAAVPTEPLPRRHASGRDALQPRSTAAQHCTAAAQHSREPAARTHP